MSIIFFRRARRRRDGRGKLREEIPSELVRSACARLSMPTEPIFGESGDLLQRISELEAERDALACELAHLRGLVLNSAE